MTTTSVASARHDEIYDTATYPTGTYETGTYRGATAPRLTSFAWKLRTVVGSLVLVSVAAGAAMLGFALRNRALSEQLARREMQGLGLVLNIDRDGYQAVLGLLKAHDAPRPVERDTWLRFFDENIGQMRERLTAYLALPGLDRSRLVTARSALSLRGEMAERGTLIRGLLTRGDAASSERALVHLDSLQRQLDSLRVFLDRLETRHDSEGDSLNARVLAGGRAAERLGSALLVVLTVVGLFSISFLSRAVTEPVKRVAASARRIASGDLTGSDVEASTRDEVGEMARAFNRMTRDLRTMIAQIRRTATDLSGQSSTITSLTVDTQAAVSQLSGAAQHIAAGTQEQAAALNQAFHEAEEIDAAVSRIAADATQLAGSIGDSVTTARQGGDTVAALLRANATVGDLVLAHTTHVGELRRHSEQVADFVKTINGIAHQTNLLALNAAIEAARAGDAGRGFGVVATEVGRLADDASEAAERTVRTVGAMQQAIAQAIAAIEHSAQQVRLTTGQATDVGGALDNIFRALEACDQHVQALSAQAAGITARVGETTDMLRSVVKVSERNAAAAQEMSAGAEQVASATVRISELAGGSRDAPEDALERSLVGMARELEALVSSFQVSKAA